MYVCSHCHTAIVDRSRAYRDPDGFWLDRECARQLACEGQLREVDAPIVDGRGRLKGYLRMHWSEALHSFVTIPGWCDETPSVCAGGVYHTENMSGQGLCSRWAWDRFPP